LEFGQEQAQVVAAQAGEGTMGEDRADCFDRHNQDICAAVYVSVKPPRRRAPLRTNTIVPEYFGALKAAAIGAFGEEMIEGGISRDSGKPPPPPMGDFPVPSEGSARPA
jgi:hypothetical protein